MDKFNGKYYKFIAENNYAIALIDSYSIDGHQIQIITKDKSYYIKDVSSIWINNNDEEIFFNVHQYDLEITGYLYLYNKNPLPFLTMGIFNIFPLECKHNIYSIYHNVSGHLSINNNSYYFKYGYIEGDKGYNFPKRYIWYNSISSYYGLTLAIADIPFGLITFKGIIAIIKNQISIKKGKYRLDVFIPISNGYNLKAPHQGKMNRLIKENVCVMTIKVLLPLQSRSIIINGQVQIQLLNKRE